MSDPSHLTWSSHLAAPTQPDSGADAGAVFGPLDPNRAAHLRIPLRRSPPFSAARCKSDGSASSSSSRTPPLSRVCSGLWQGVGSSGWRHLGADSTGLCAAINAPGCSSPGSPHFNHSRRPRCPLDRSEHPRPRAVALLPWCFLSSLASYSGFFCTPSNSRELPPTVFGLQSPRAASPPLPPRSFTVKTVLQWRPLLSLCSSFSLSPLWWLTLSQFWVSPVGVR